MQIIIAILLIGNYGLMDIFMLKGCFQQKSSVIPSHGRPVGDFRCASRYYIILKPKSASW